MAESSFSRYIRDTGTLRAPSPFPLFTWDAAMKPQPIPFTFAPQPVVPLRIYIPALGQSIQLMPGSSFEIKQEPHLTLIFEYKDDGSITITPSNPDATLTSLDSGE